MTDNIQGAYTAGILASGAAGVDAPDDDEHANDTIIGRLLDARPAERDSDGTPIGSSDAAADAAPN